MVPQHADYGTEEKTTQVIISIYLNINKSLNSACLRLFFSIGRTDIKLCEVCGLVFPRKLHLNKQIEEFVHTTLQKWRQHEIKYLPLLDKGEWIVGAFRDGLTGVSAMASIFLNEIRHEIMIIVMIIIIQNTRLLIILALWFSVFTPEWNADTLVPVSL